MMTLDRPFLVTHALFVLTRLTLDHLPRASRRVMGAHKQDEPWKLFISLHPPHEAYGVGQGQHRVGA